MFGNVCPRRCDSVWCRVGSLSSSRVLLFFEAEVNRWRFDVLVCVEAVNDVAVADVKVEVVLVVDVRVVTVHGWRLTR